MYNTNNKVEHSSISKILFTPIICTICGTRCPNGRNEINNKMLHNVQWTLLAKLNTKIAS